MLTELGHDSSVGGVARLYAEIASTLVIDTEDADRVEQVRAEGIEPLVTNTIMSDSDVATTLATSIINAR